MNRAGRQFLCFLVLLLIYSVLRFPYSKYGNKMLAELQRSARNEGIMLDVPDVSVEFPGVLIARNISLVIPLEQIRVPIFVDSFKLSPSILSLFMLRLSFAGDLQIYGGLLELEMEKSIFGDEIAFSLVGSKVNIASHQILRRLGFTGLLNLEVKGVAKQITDKSIYELGDLSLEVAVVDGKYTGKYRVAGMVEIPNIQDIQLTAKSRARNNSIKLESLEMFSSLGVVKTQGAGMLSKSFLLEKGNADIDIRLTPEGQKAFGGYLALAAGVSLDTKSEHWSVKASKDIGKRQPNVLVRPGT
jgi:type II secretion system protein N